MKKALTIVAIAALAASTHAASLLWGGGGTINVIDNGTVTGWNQYVDTATGTRPDSGYLALFYLGQTGSLSGIGDLTAAQAVQTIPTLVQTGKNDNKIANPTYVATDAEYDPGATFQIFWVSEAGALQNIYAIDGVTPFNTQRTLMDLSEVATVDALYASGATNINYAVMATPVPEPATAALALAGLALLMRRRK